MSKIILASASPRRLQLLYTLGFDIIVMEPKVDEFRLENEDPHDMVTRLAKLKAESIQPDEKLGSISSIPVIAADTIVCIDDHILGKPKDEEDAVRMLKLLSNQTHEVVTGYTIKLGKKEIVKSVITKVSFRELTLEQIQAYIKTKEPMDKAGSYGIQGFGANLIDQIQGSYTNVVGLPIKEVLSSLNEILLPCKFCSRKGSKTNRAV